MQTIRWAASHQLVQHHCFLNSENIYIGFCTLPLGRWIQPWATWNYNNWTFRTCEHRQCKVIGYETWNSINWIFYVHIFIIHLHLKIKKASVLPSIHFPLFILSLSSCQPISTKLRSQALLMMKITRVSSVNGSYPPSAKEGDDILVQENLFHLVDNYKKTMYVISSNDVGWVGIKQLVCERRQG